MAYYLLFIKVVYANQSHSLYYTYTDYKDSGLSLAPSSGFGTNMMEAPVHFNESHRDTN